MGYKEQLPPGAGGPPQTDPIVTLNNLIMGETIAADSYRTLARRARNGYQKGQMRRIEQSHRRHIDLLRKRVQQLGGRPGNGAGWPGLMNEAMLNMTAWISPTRALRRVYNGEDKGIHMYEDALEHTPFDPATQKLIKRIASADHDHLKTLERLLH